MHPRCLALVASLLLGACATPPPRDADTALTLPAHWQRASDAPNPVTVSPDWWRHFGSEELARLIDEADRQSHDIAASAGLVRQAQAAARAAGALRAPAVVLQLGSARANADGPAHTQFSSSLAATYEVDLWGRLQAGHQSALAILAASQFDRQTVRLGIASSVASTWLEAVAMQELIDVAGQDLGIARQTLSLVEARRRAGAATALDLARQQGLVAERERDLASLQRRLDDARVILGRLVGETGPRELRRASLAELTPPAVDAGLPSTLLLRRPDLARAEAQLAAADADILAARGAMLPSLNLGASLGASGAQLVQILENPAYSVAAALTAPLFNAGRLAALRDGAEARRETLLANYRGAITTAFADTQTALNASAWLDAQYRAQQDVQRHAETAWRLADARYRAGAIGMLDVLDAQRSLYAARSATLQLRLARLQASVSLFRALGGGWEAASGAG